MKRLLLLSLLTLAACERTAPADLQAVVEAERQQLKDGCGILIDSPTLLIQKTNGHGHANCHRNTVVIPEDAVKNDKPFVEQSLIPHEVAHLGHCEKYGKGGHTKEFWVIEEYMRGVTETCSNAISG